MKGKPLSGDQKSIKVGRMARGFNRISYVGVLSASSALPRQKRTAISIPKPRAPLNITEKIMDLGIIMAAFSISSANHMNTSVSNPH